MGKKIILHNKLHSMNLSPKHNIITSSISKVQFHTTHYITTKKNINIFYADILTDKSSIFYQIDIQKVHFCNNIPYNRIWLAKNCHFIAEILLINHLYLTHFHSFQSIQMALHRYSGTAFRIYYQRNFRIKGFHNHYIRNYTNVGA